MPPRKENICALCHGQRTGCCTLGAGSQEQMFGLTKDEIKEMAKASGLAPRDFVVEDRIGRDFQDLLRSINPVFLKTMPGGRRLRLRLNPFGDCIFLGSRGCTLPRRARPIYCRLYPFCFTAEDRLMVLLSDTCLAQKGAGSWHDVIERMGEDETGLRRLFARFKENAREHAEWAAAGGTVDELN
ncbi:YkgJ family cysteine cluster protein [Dethiosulfatarculus sandiegensis]|nr:YkgJ family cysteine cluster protein [Dethiosulfatarculus sandiegensis]